MSLRRVILAVAALLALPTFASAQTSRIEGMSLPGDYVKDYTGIYTYPSCVTGVGNLVYGELGITGTAGVTPGDRSVGAVLQNLFDGKLGTWGVHLRELTPSLGQGDFISSTNVGTDGFDPNVNTNESFDLMWGRKFGTTSLGIRLNRSYYQAKTEPLAGVETKFQYDATAGGSPNLARNVWGVGGGLSFESSANMRSDVSFLYQSRSWESTTGTTKDESDGNGSYLLAARAFYQWEPNVVLVPVFKYYSYDLSEKLAGPPVTTFDNSLKGWQAGVAGNWTVGNNDLFVLGVAFAQNKVEQAEAVFAIDTDPTAPGTQAMTDGKSTETLAPEVFAALETHVNNWLTLRFGASKSAYRKLKVEPTAGGNSETTTSPFSMNIGAGVKLATLQLDAVLSQDFPQTLGWIGSGNAGVYFPKVTATYAF